MIKTPQQPPDAALTEEAKASCVVIEGVYSKGMIRLVKQRALTADVCTPQTVLGWMVTEHESAANADSDNGGCVGAPGAACDMRTYKIFLSGVMAGGCVGQKAHEALGALRRKYGLSEDHHKDALKAVGLTKGQYNLLKGEAGSTAGGGPQTEEDVCKICFVERINSVILPCGHYAICTSWSVPGVGLAQWAGQAN